MNVPALPLEQPVDWIVVPAGKVKIKGETFGYVRKEETKTFDVPNFYISKHPITNAQFFQFIAAGGYSQKRWWSESGWLVKQRKSWQPPNIPKIASPNLPVTGVSWFEAVAFCLWLIAETGTSIMLPTEQQWQRAAEYANSSLDSGFSANIIEWCLTEWKSGRAYLDLNSTRLYDEFLHDPDDDPFDPVMRATNFVLRGGNWRATPTIIWGTDLRRWSQPHERKGNQGFRIALG